MEVRAGVESRSAMDTPNHMWCPSTKPGSCLLCGKPQSDPVHSYPSEKPFNK